MRHAFVDIGDKTMCSRCGNQVFLVDEECPAITDGQIYAKPRERVSVKPVSECDHAELYFGSGDYYVMCRECQAKWGRLGTDGRHEYGSSHGVQIGCDPQAANRGPTLGNHDIRLKPF